MRVSSLKWMRIFEFFGIYELISQECGYGIVSAPVKWTVKFWNTKQHDLKQHAQTGQQSGRDRTGEMERLIATLAICGKDASSAYIPERNKPTAISTRCLQWCICRNRITGNLIWKRYARSPPPKIFCRWNLVLFSSSFTPQLTPQITQIVMKIELK